MRSATVQLWLLLAGITGLTGGCITGPTLNHPPALIAVSERPAHNLRVFDRVATLVKNRFYDAKLLGVDWKAVTAEFRPKAEKAANDVDLYEQVLNPMLDRLKSSHLRAISPQDAYEHGTEHRAMLGLRHQRVDGKWVVREVIPDSPAAAAGVRAGWIALTLNGKTPDQGPFHFSEGQEVKAEFLDENDQPRSLMLNARLVSTKPRLEARELAGGIWYLRFDEFNVASRRWLSAQLKAHASAPGVVIDVRLNPGGGWFSLRFVVSEFFPGDVPVGAFIFRGGRPSEDDSLTWLSAHFSGRVAVLIGPLSASSSEIFAHVMKAHGRATLVGQKTSGAVIGSLFFPLPGEGKLQMAMFDYHGVDGRRLEGEGVAPNVEVWPKLADLRAGRDPELEAALLELRPAVHPVALTSGGMRARLGEDRQNPNGFPSAESTNATRPSRVWPLDVVGAAP